MALTRSVVAFRQQLELRVQAQAVVGLTRAVGVRAAVVDDTGAAVSITATDDRWVALSGAVAAKLAPFRFLKLVSASEEEAARTIRFAVRPR